MASNGKINTAMQKLSVVIVCKNEEDKIGRCLQSLRGLTDDIVVLDNGSTDGTKNIVQTQGARLIEDSWEGYGKTKAKATLMAKYDWTINLDADEVVTEELKYELLNLELESENEVFSIPFKNFFGEKHLRYGEWGIDRHVRLFNRKKVNWDQAVVHEDLALAPGTTIMKLKGFILHYTLDNIAEYAEKMQKYAMLKADQYALKGKKASWLKLWLGPAFAFLKYYFLQLGFLDGAEGFICAKMTSYYTYLKYARLLELNRAKAKRPS
jgi:glycosyltransferase involved in cell wall biosynthesis